MPCSVFGRLRSCARGLCLTAAVILLAGPIAAADRPAQKHPVSSAAPAEEAAETAAPLPQPAEQPNPDEIEKRFYRGVNQSRSGNAMLAASEFVGVRDDLSRLGFSGAPEFSRRLIESGYRRYAAGDLEGAASLFKSAVLLSPDSPEILLASASFPSAVGYRRSAELFFSGLVTLTRDPIACAKLLVNFVLVGLIAATLSIAVMLVIQITRNCEMLHFALGKKLPIKIRGFVTPLLLAVLITVPLRLGIVGAVGCWSLLLAFLLPRRRRLALAAGALILAWGLSIEHLAAMALNIKSPAGRLLSNQAAGRFIPGEEEEFEAQMPELSKQYLGAILSGMAKFRRQDANQAEQYFAEARARARSDNERLAAMIDLSAVLYSQKRFSEARDVLQTAQQLGTESYELYYNLANVSIALLDVEGHRRYLQLAAAIDRSRAFAAEQLDSNNRPPALIMPPWLSVFRSVFTPIQQVNRSAAAVVAADSQALLGTMLPIRRSGAFVIFGALVFLAGLVFKKPQEIIRPDGPAFELPSRIWAVFPAGRALAGDRPLLGVVLLAAVLGLALLYVGVPPHLFELRAGGLDAFAGFAWSAALIWVIAASLGFSARTVSSAVAEENR